MPSKNSDSGSETRPCGNCGEIISATARFCPGCGAQQPIRKRSENQPTKQGATEDTGDSLTHWIPGIDEGNTKRRNILTAFGYSLVGSVLLIWASMDNTYERNEYPNAYAYEEGIVVRNVAWDTTQYATKVIGEATNKSGIDYRYVEISFGLYDSSGAKIGSAFDNITGLPAETTWRFDALGITGETTEIKFEGISSF